MLTKRIIPCLDVKNGRTVKGISFGNLADAGDPVELAARYSQEGADELVLLDITATLEGRKTFLNVVWEVARCINIPFTVGGGISAASEVEALLAAGADKVSVNTSALLNPELITALANRFGNLCVVVAIDTKLTANGWEVVSHAGTRSRGIDTVRWAKEAQERGAGEILLTSFTSDGSREGYALDITAGVSDAVTIPVVASGGAGELHHFHQVLTSGKADAALAAGVFHFKKFTIGEVKHYLNAKGLNVRL